MEVPLYGGCLYKKLVTLLVTAIQKLGDILWKIAQIFIKNPHFFNKTDPF